MADMPFKGNHIQLPPPTPDIDPKIEHLEQSVLSLYRNAASKPYVSNLTPTERRGFKKLLEARQHLRYTVGDKCGSFVVMPQVLDKTITYHVLSDTTVYEESTETAFRRSCENVRHVIMSIVKNRLGTAVAKRLNDQSPATPTLYNLVKTHKIPTSADNAALSWTEIKTRPIISSCGGPSDKLSWLLVRLLSPLLRYVRAHIVNTDEFLTSLRQCPVPESAVYASFDVVSLYTNVNNPDAIDAVLSILEDHQDELNMMGFSASDIRILLEAALQCNIFCFDNKFYKQRRGLAMGNRIAPILAVIFLDKIEKMSLSTNILFYKRYIDDTFIIATDEQELDITLERLNSHDTNITFTMEEPGENGFLPFLNTRVRIIEGRKEYTWFKKTASSNILLHSRSAHPMFMKANVVRNLVKTKEKLTNSEDSSMNSKILTILENNGYKLGSFRTWKPYRTADGVTLVLPYVNEVLAIQVNKVVKLSKLPVRLVFRPPATLKDLLTCSRLYEKQCHKNSCMYCSTQALCELRGTVYLLRCRGCGDKYVGETSRPLKLRLDEHRRAFTNPSTYPKESFSKHRTSKHPNTPAPMFDVMVLHRHLMHPLERKIMEAKEIQRIRPEINAKEELHDVLRLIT